ncbi:cobalamin biosynthesis protein [Vulcanisaeta distributa]|uniref:cobalamin biosynthesis protein n=1 Tax=Vulcanisaeta distributa TaxID=164451 RepID=UPI0006D07A1D|nr:cobalamin biosynthesis protein [Vulcanisaeta distributa]
MITTAAEYMGITGIEELARLLHCDIINTEELPSFYSALLGGKPVCIVGIDKLPSGVKGNYMVGLNTECEYAVVVGDTQQSLGGGIRVLRCMPYKVIIGGVGLMNEAGVDEVIKAIRAVLDRLGIEVNRVLTVASIKPRVGEAAKALGLPFRLVGVDELRRIDYGCATPPSDELRRLGIRGCC